MIAGQTNSPTTTPITLVFSGIQGSGKGTQVELLKQFIEKKHPGDQVLIVGMGDILRAYTRENSNPFAQKVADIMARGALLPGFAQSYILNHYLQEHCSPEVHLLFEAVARSIPQAILFEEIMQFYDRPEYQIISLEMSAQAARERLSKRGRYDETSEEQLNRRLTWHQNETVPALNWLAEKGHMVHHIDAEPSIEEVHATLLSVLNLA